MPWFCSVQWNEERGEQNRRELQSEEKRGFGYRGNMVIENLNHPNETYELVSRFCP